MVDSTYAYLLADEHTTQVIQQLKNTAEKARMDLASYIGSLKHKDGTSAGGQVTFVDGNRNPVFSFADNRLPPGWHLKPSTTGAEPSPYPLPPNHYDENAEMALTKILACTRKQQLQTIFNDCCNVRAGTSPHNPQRFSFEEYGDKIVIICPPTPQADTFNVPQGCTEISYECYLQLKNASTPSKPRTLRPFSLGGSLT